MCHGDRAAVERRRRVAEIQLHTPVLRQLGQDLFAPPNVRGWPGGEAWINSSTLLARKQFVEQLLRREDRMDMHEAMLDPAWQLK